MSDSIEITYELTYHHQSHVDGSIEALLREIALEQTVEVPDGYFLNQPHINTTIVPTIKDVRPIDQGRYRATLSFNPEVTAYQLPQFLNVLFGNISFKGNVRVVGIDLPEDFLKVFKGPGYGIPGIRQMLGVYGRPLLCAVLKPMGLSSADLANLAAEFAFGGADIIKDDHGLVDQTFCPFEQRLTLCQQAIEAANAKTSHKTLYFPNVTDSADKLEDRIRFALRCGVAGVLVAPYLVGLDTVRYLASTYRIIIMAHPAMTGAYFHDPNYGIRPSVLLGSVFRLMGADLSIFPNAGGRFNFTPEESLALSHSLRAPFGQLKPAFPAPAGGMSLSNIPDMAAMYGVDTVYTIGGSLLKHPDDIRDSTRVFLEKITSGFSQATCQPSTQSSTPPRQSTSPLTSVTLGEVFEHLSFREDFGWSGRPPRPYKDGVNLPFRYITRHELIGRYGEETRFDLRYFQIEPGGYSSLERHLHIHVVICIRGEGVFIIGGNRYTLRPFDVAYIAPMHPHQLLNESDAPFGFFCIVDHERDRPIPL
uniref:Rubisco-like protein n=2 Tax=Candidatus Magnetobacterium bavaricum TaxID=29290 RepID=D7GXD0_9BACT|nr:rubisco-like protein [Candidatus Magnetobacterium bavaricum]